MGQKALENFSTRVDMIRDNFAQAQKEFSKSIVGNTQILSSIFVALVSNGHVLLEGAPGLGKTLMIRTIARIMDLDFRRVQFTPDLMPADIIGTNIIVEDGSGDRHFRFERGPIFSQILLADEINRASPKTQSALLQAMEEHEVTVFGENYKLDEIFFTLATQNPIEMAGTYPLPEAQMDRFFFKLVVPYPSRDHLKQIGALNMMAETSNSRVNKVLSAEQILEMRKALSQMPITDRIYDFAVNLIQATHPENTTAPEIVRSYVRYGASPRGMNAILAASRVSAAMDGRANISIEDIESNFLPALRHRLVIRFEGEMEGVTPDVILQNIYSSLRKKL